MKKKIRRPRIKTNRVLAGMKRIERLVLVWWIRFARKHRNSHLLPLGLFGLLFLDAFVIVIPSLLCLAAAITISPKRWWFFALLFGFATVCNNSVTYWFGRMMPADVIVEFFHSGSFKILWETAEQAIRDYGYFATFFGALLSLPTQVMTLIMGMTDASVLRADPTLESSFFRILVFVFLGHTIKVMIFSAVIRYGWVKLEKKIAREDPRISMPKDL